MINYNKLTYQIKRKLPNFSNKITRNISRPKSKFVFQMIYGLLESNSVHLSNIARALKEDISLNKTIERLSKNLNNFNEIQEINEMYLNEIKSFIDNETIFCIDGSEIIKPHSKSLESIGTVRDGSTGNTNVNGYNIFEVAALITTHDMPVSIYPNFISLLHKVVTVDLSFPIKFPIYFIVSTPSLSYKTVKILP